MFDIVLDKVRSIKVFFRRVRRSIQSLWYWLPVILEDRQWDQSYMWRILHHKLAVMYRELSRDPYVIWGHHEMRRLRHAVELARRLSEGDYDRWMQRHDELFGKARMDFGPSENGLRTCTILRPGCEQEPRKSHERRCFKKAIDADERERQEDLEKLLDIIKRGEGRWWT